MQVIGPQQAETIPIQGIEEPRKTVQIAIPKELQKNGGSFEIDLGK
jgi:nucleoporin POM152